MGDVDHIMSIFVTSFNLMTTFPRFSNDREEGDELVWGHSHEDWHRAVSILRFNKSRRASAKNYPFRSKVAQGTPAAFAGFATPERIARTKVARQLLQSTATAAELKSVLICISQVCSEDLCHLSLSSDDMEKFAKATKERH